jgi:hypothetical protein
MIEFVIRDRFGIVIHDDVVRVHVQPLHRDFTSEREAAAAGEEIANLERDWNRVVHRRGPAFKRCA